MRKTKEYDERRNEILDAAQKLFHKKGYVKCTVKDILKEVDIAKGTFYYYFSSKEEVLNAVVFRYTDIVIKRVEALLTIDNLRPEEKLIKALLAMRVSDDEVDSNMLDELHKTDNALLHQKMLNKIIMLMAPILQKIIEEGIEKKVWVCKYPLQYMQIFLSASLTITDEGIFDLDYDAQIKMITALLSLLEKMLAVPEDLFMNLYIKYSKEKYL